MGWMETVIGIGYAPIAVPVGAAITAISGGGGGGLEPTVGPIAHVEIQGPLNIVEIEGVPIESSGGGTVPQPFNQGTIGLVPFHKNKGDTIDEIVKNAPSPPPIWSGDVDRIPEDTKSEIRKYLENFLKLGTPPSYTYKGPIAGAGFLGLFAPTPGSPEYEAFVAGKKEAFVAGGKEATQKLNLNPDTPPAEKENKWNVQQTWGDFLKGFQKGFEKDQEVGFWDMILSFVNISQWPLMAIIAGGVLLMVVVLR